MWIGRKEEIFYDEGGEALKQVLQSFGCSIIGSVQTLVGQDFEQPSLPMTERSDWILSSTNPFVIQAQVILDFFKIFILYFLCLRNYTGVKNIFLNTDCI